MYTINSIIIRLFYWKHRYHKTYFNAFLVIQFIASHLYFSYAIVNEEGLAIICRLSNLHLNNYYKSWLITEIIIYYYYKYKSKSVTFCTISIHSLFLSLFFIEEEKYLISLIIYITSDRALETTFNSHNNCKETLKQGQKVVHKNVS